jgi:hypothetical protein
MRLTNYAQSPAQHLLAGLFAYPGQTVIHTLAYLAPNLAHRYLAYLAPNLAYRYLARAFKGGRG